jgi:3-deoxy-D-manno-octulosonate 8-phosphate phosphatase (KDO 8-P phosphatase)
VQPKTMLETFIVDVDGVLTTGHFVYSSEGKQYKIFGPDDADALNILKNHMSILCISADHRGFPISKKRIVEDMGLQLELVDGFDRVNWITERFDLQKVVYMGDGFLDHLVMQRVAYSLAPSSASEIARQSASHVTKCSGGNRAVAEACFHLMDKFFEPIENFFKSYTSTEPSIPHA